MRRPYVGRTKSTMPGAKWYASAVVRGCLIATIAIALLGCSRADANSPATSQPSSGPPVETSASLLPPPAPSAFVHDPKYSGHVVALAWETKVYELPKAKSVILGYLRAGAVVAATPKPAGNDGCAGGWYPIEPTGYVCADKDNASTDPDHPLSRALARRPDPNGRLPYMYGVVRKPGPLYGRIPTRAEAEKEEPGIDARMREWLGATGEDGAKFRTDYWVRWKSRAATDPQALWDAKTSEDIPDWLAGGKLPPKVTRDETDAKAQALVLGQTRHHTGLALVDTFVSEGRRYGLTTDLEIYPVDRMRPIEGSAFHGYRIPEDGELPFAIVRREGAAAFRLNKGKLVKERDLPRRSIVKLGKRKQFLRGHLHFQTDDGLWVSDQFASKVEPLKHPPKWAKGTTAHWIDVSIGKQVLVAYEGEKPVFVTLVSTGEAGLEDPETTKSTKTGIFRIHTKHVTTKMASNVVGEEFELRDIPYVQYFEAGYALHASYWHDDFGTPRSHGCINLSPEDAKWLFQFTEPAVPPSWHGARKSLTGSIVFVHP